jgi:hypothetical protein
MPASISSSGETLGGKEPGLTPRQQAELVRMHGTGDRAIAGLMEVFSVGRATVYQSSNAPAPPVEPRT